MRQFAQQVTGARRRPRVERDWSQTHNGGRENSPCNSRTLTPRTTGAWTALVHRPVGAVSGALASISITAVSLSCSSIAQSSGACSAESLRARFGLHALASSAATTPVRPLRTAGVASRLTIGSIGATIDVCAGKQQHLNKVSCGPAASTSAADGSTPISNCVRTASTSLREMASVSASVPFAMRGQSWSGCSLDIVIEWLFHSIQIHFVR